MPYFIKPGFWLKTKKNLKGSLNLTKLIEDIAGSSGPTTENPVLAGHITQLGLEPIVFKVLENNFESVATLTNSGIDEPGVFRLVFTINIEGFNPENLTVEYTGKKLSSGDTSNIMAVEYTPKFPSIFTIYIGSEVDGRYFNSILNNEFIKLTYYENGVITTLPASVEEGSEEDSGVEKASNE